MNTGVSIFLIFLLLGASFFLSGYLFSENSRLRDENERLRAETQQLKKELAAECDGEILWIGLSELKQPYR